MDTNGAASEGSVSWDATLSRSQCSATGCYTVNTGPSTNVDHDTEVSVSCAINLTVECGWEVAYKSMKTIEQLDLFNEVLTPKNWSSRGTGGPGRVVREDMKL